MQRILITAGATSLALGLWAFAGQVVFAASDESAKDRVLNAEEIRALTVGKTFHYRLKGDERGEEQHTDDGKATWVLPDGSCYHGIWVVNEQVLCYYYGALRYGCWNVVERDGQYRHSPLDLDGTPTGGSPVIIERISEEPVGCAPQQLASLPY